MLFENCFCLSLLTVLSHPYMTTGKTMWELDHKESWVLQNWCFWTVVLGTTLASPLDCKKIQPLNSKGNQSWVIIGSTDAEAETTILWLPDVKNWLIGKDPDAGKDWRQEEKGTTEDEMAGWCHQLDEHEFEQAVRVGDGQGSLASWSSLGHNATGRLNWTELYRPLYANLCLCFSIHHLGLSCLSFQRARDLISWLQSPSAVILEPKWFFSSGHVRMWELDHKEGWAPKNWCFQIVVPEKTLDSPFNCKEIKLVNPKGNHPWIFGRTDAEVPIFWPPDEKNWLIGKDPDAGKDWRQKEKGVGGRGWDGWKTSLTQCT